MKVKQEEYDVGIIVGRFQLDSLHSAHESLIQSVCDQHSRVILFLGLAPVINTTKNPLDYETRRQMINQSFPEVTVSYISDVHSDELWSQTLDREIGKLISPTQNAILYGGRDSFLSAYSGKYPTRELHQETYVSGTDIRKKLSKKVKASPDFRHGVVWASANRYPTVFTTTDIAIFDDTYEKILLGRKETEDKFRFVGGFSDPKDISFEHTALREMREETGLSTLHGAADVEYITSMRINDWRYAAEVDKINTILYAVRPVGTPSPSDDIFQLKWHSVQDLLKDENFPNLVPQHAELMKAALIYALQKQQPQNYRRHKTK